jgi:hypothetical protein
MNKKHGHSLNLDKELLYDYYVNKGYSLKRLADEVFFCSHPTVLNYMKLYGIERRKTGRTRKKK